MKRHPLPWLFLILSGLCATGLSAEHMVMEVRIAGQTAHLALDTGAEMLALFDAGARRLGLDVEPPPPTAQARPGMVVPSRTKPCDVQIGGATMHGPVPVVTLPGYIDAEIDGVIGWNVICQNVVAIDALSKNVLIRDRLPSNMPDWSHWKIHPDARRLVIEIPTRDADPETVMIDTGNASGVVLAPRRWQQWTEAHPDQPTTFEAAFFPGVGVVATEERWAHLIDLDGMVFHEVSVSEYDARMHQLAGHGHAAMLGLNAVQRLSWVIDGSNGKVYFQDHGAPQGSNKYEYNRLGAVFIPTAGRGDALVAHVAQNNPAQRAGIRNGDVLLRINDLDATPWRTDPRVLPLSRFWSQPAGTTLDLGLRRGEETFAVKVVLEDIFPTQFSP